MEMENKDLRLNWLAMQLNKLNNLAYNRYLITAYNEYIFFINMRITLQFDKSFISTITFNEMSRNMRLLMLSLPSAY